MMFTVRSSGHEGEENVIEFLHLLCFLHLVCLELETLRSKEEKKKNLSYIKIEEVNVIHFVELKEAQGGLK